MNVRALIFGGRGASSAAGDFGLLLLRVTAGASLAFGHGIGKLPPGEKFVAGLHSLGLPAPELFAWLAALAEFGGGCLLALGLLTRPAALAIAITMAVAIFGQNLHEPFAKKELAICYFAPALLYLFAGPGRYSLDALFAGSKKKA